jgi:glycosyltransferase involved in cell wall biosynthesis
MKIVILGSFSPDSVPGGITTHCTRLAERLTSEQDFSVCKINIRPKIANCAALFVNNPVVWLLRIFLLRLRGFSLFHFHTSSRGIPFLLLAPWVWLLGGKNVISFHSGRIGADLLKTGKNFRFFQFVFFFADTVLFMNESEARILSEKFPKHTAKIKSIHSFIIPSKKPEPPAEKPAGFSIATMGAWLRHYSFEDVVSVAKELALAHPSIHFNLTFVAALFNIDTAYKQEILASAENTSKDAPNLNITSIENLSETLVFFSGIDVLIRSSSVDSFGLCVAEAAFCGKPVIATNVCRRVAGTFLYAPHDLVTLKKLLFSIFERVADGTLGKIELDPAEDAYPALLKLYQSNV